MLIYLLPKAGILPQAGNVAITKTNFSDDIFRQYVQEHFDKDQNGILSDAELSSVTEIILVDTIVVLDDTVVDTTVVAMDTEYPIIVPETKIKSLAGIEYFTNLTKLDCRNNSISTLDVSKNTALTTLDCSYNSISTLDVSKNTALTTLVCSFNSLS
ncbi:MAG: leucine-rich repeat domain-containing protein, partial [Paludibacteraceae bacterium]